MAGAMLPTRRSERRIAELKERNVTLRGTGERGRIIYTTANQEAL